MTEETPINHQSKHILSLASNEEVISYLKKQFSRLDKMAAITLARKILDGNTNSIDIIDFKGRTKYKSFLQRNLAKFDTVVVNGVESYKIKEEILQILKTDIFTLLENIGTSIKDADEDENKWAKSQIDGIEAFEVNKHTTFQMIREKLDLEGKDSDFRYSFKKPDMKPSVFKNKSSLQMINVHINDNGEFFGFPLKYTYMCPECATISERMEYEVASAGNKIKCPAYLDMGEDGKIKRCNQALSPDANRTETKDCYIYNISYDDGKGVLQKSEAISFLKLPRGLLRVVLQKIPRAYGQNFVHIVDFEPIETDSLKLPTKTERHYIFDLVKAMDEYIFEKTKYKHYGFLPMKLATLIQFAARYLPSFSNDLNISLSGEASSGKSQFARYWGMALYGQSCLMSNATSISIPKLRGTMESFRLFGKDYRYQYKGLLGEMDLIIIDEVKESIELKNNLKQYALESTYEYNKAGSNNQSFTRTAQLLTTQNIDTIHLDKYSKAVMKIYTAEELRPVSDDDEPKPSWTKIQNEDLTLPLFSYKNKYLRYSIKKVRDDYERNAINWIDGSEIALKQRFYFYFFLGSDVMNKELADAIKENSTQPDVVKESTEMIRIMNSNSLIKELKNRTKLLQGTNDVEYFNKVDKILNAYEKRKDARTKTMSYAILKILRILDNRNYCTDEDLKIFQYLVEYIDNKVQIVDTNLFEIKGHTIVDDSLLDNQVEEAKEAWSGYDQSIEDFK